MLLPVLDSLSSNEEGGDRRVDSSPVFFLKSVFTQVRRGWGKTKHSTTEGRGAPPSQGRPGGGWRGLVWLGKADFESA